MKILIFNSINLVMFFSSPALAQLESFDFIGANQGVQAQIQERVPVGQQCMSYENLQRLNEVILCQQLVNPIACDEAIRYFRENQGPSMSTIDGASSFGDSVAVEQPTTPISDAQIRTDAYNSVMTGGITAALNARSIVRAIHEARANNAMIGSIFSRAAQAGRALNPAEYQAVRTAFGNLKNLGHIFPQYARLPSMAAITPAFVGNIMTSIRSSMGAAASAVGTNAVARGVGVGAARMLAVMANPYLAAGVVLAQAFVLAGQITSRIQEANRGCTADDRAEYGNTFMCVTERCNNHYLACQNMMGLILQGDLNAQMRALAGTDDQTQETCTYLNSYLGHVNQEMAGVTLRSCNENDGEGLSAASIQVAGYQDVDIRESMVNPDRAPDVNRSRDINLKIYFENGVMQRSVVLDSFSSQIGHTRFDFHYHENGELNFWRPVRPNPSYDPETNGMRFSMMGGVATEPPELLGVPQYRDDLIPPDNTGLFGMTQSHRPRDWPVNQAFLFQGRMSQIYHEVRRCCYPQNGESCRLTRSASPQTGPFAPVVPVERDATN